MTFDRLDLPTTAPDLFQAALALDDHLKAGIPSDLLHLVKLRASMVNGCSFCVDMHSTEALRDGESTIRLFAVAAWRESPVFDDRERAVLALTDAITDIRSAGVTDEVFAAAARYFDDKMMVDLIGAASLINFWNRVTITLRTTPPSARLAQSQR